MEHIFDVEGKRQVQLYDEERKTERMRERERVRLAPDDDAGGEGRGWALLHGRQEPAGDNRQTTLDLMVSV